MARLTPQQRWRLYASRNAERLERVKSSIRKRWVLPDWDITFPWWREPSRVRILMYAEGDLTFGERLFRGFSHVTTLLNSRPYPYVDFELTTAHRNSANAGASAPSPIQLTDPRLDILNNFDEIWLFGFNNDPALSDEERDLLKTFMNDHFGGVLVTGDHDNRGRSIAQQVLRAGKMRKFPSPPSEFPRWNNSLEEGPDPLNTFDVDDQSDDLPQTIRYETFPVTSLPGFKPLSLPHPVLCGPDGPIDVLPDHQHEGEVDAPAVDAAGEEWPRKNGHQEQPVIIAHAITKEPGTGNREFPVLAAYDGHNVDVGRIVADASWHHWLDDNILGVRGSDIYKGFDISPEGRIALKKIDSYFLNCGVWLAPPAKQREMRNAAWWSILWTSDVAELSPHMPLRDLGKQAISLLRRYASTCAVSDWIFDTVNLEGLSESEMVQLSEGLSQDDTSLEQFLAGAILQSLMTTIGPFNPDLEFPFQPPPDEIIEGRTSVGIEAALLNFK